MTKATRINKGRFLTLILRHKPEQIGATLDGNGWLSVSTILEKLEIKQDQLDEIVAFDEKGRFEYNKDRSMIRACQGHSVDVEIDFPMVEPPVYLYHGTVAKHLDGINDSGGLRPMSRNFVHLSADIETARKVGKRHGKHLMIFKIHARLAHKMNTIQFYYSNNGVYLAKFVPSRFMEIIQG